MAAWIAGVSRMHRTTGVGDESTDLPTATACLFGGPRWRWAGRRGLLMLDHRGVSVLLEQLIRWWNGEGLVLYAYADSPELP